MVGFVSLVGAGQQAPELLTLAGRDRLARADVVIADNGVNPAVLRHCRPDADIIQADAGSAAFADAEDEDTQGIPLPVGDETQRISLTERDETHDLLVEHARAGRWVVRLKGGDPWLLGRSVDDAQVLCEHGIPFEFVPVDLREKPGWCEQLPLNARRVGVTSTDRLASALIGLLAADGADAVSLPCLAVAPPPDPAELERAAGRLRGDYDGVVLSSPNGVRALFDALARQGLTSRSLSGTTVAAIGAETSAALYEGGVVADVVATRARSEGLVDLLRDHGLLRRRWLHVRADEGRAVLGQAIEAAGGGYDLVIGYATVRPDLPGPLVCSLRDPERDGEGIDALCFASGKAARHFLESATELLGDDEARATVAHARIVTIGPVTTSALEALDIRVDATAQSPNAHSMLDAVREVLREHG